MIEHINFSRALLGAFCLCLLAVSVRAGLRDSIRNPPRKCCAPQAYEANLQSTGANYKGGVEQQEYDIHLAYDYMNLRWAYHTQDPTGEANNTRLIYDHKNHMKYLIRNGECFKSKNEGPMEEQCIPSNATYHGYFEYGFGRHQKLGYDMWSYEYVLYPLRQVIKVARQTCMPIQEGGYGLVANTWAWHVPEPSCVPWASHELIEETAKGMCKKCYQEMVVKRRGTQLTGLHNSAIFTDIVVGIENEEIFDVPEDCKKIKSFGHDLRLEPSAYGFVMRLHQDRTFELDEELNRPPPGPKRRSYHK